MSLALVEDKKYLPATIDELHQFILIGQEQLKAHKAKIRAIEKIDMALSAKKAALNDAQDIGDILLDAQAKLGGMIENTELTKGGRGKTGSLGGTSLSNIGITKKESHYAQELARHQDIVEGVKQRAREQGEIPTTSAVLKEIKQRKIEEKIANAQSNMKLNTCASSNLQRYIEEGCKFGTIYADPPWAYSNQGTRSATNRFYPTMTVDEIAALPVPLLSADNAHLHLWTTNAFLPDSFKIIEAWGFEYKSCFIWAKPKMGIGNYWRVSHEFLLLGVKGDCKQFREHHHKSWMEIPASKHSEKPEDIAHIISKVSPGPYLELFARKHRKDWSVWGNEIYKGMPYQGTINE